MMWWYTHVKKRISNIWFCTWWNVTLAEVDTNRWYHWCCSWRDERMINPHKSLHTSATNNPQQVLNIRIPTLSVCHISVSLFKIIFCPIFHTSKYFWGWNSHLITCQSCFFGLLDLYLFFLFAHRNLSGGQLFRRDWCVTDVRHHLPASTLFVCLLFQPAHSSSYCPLVTRGTVSAGGCPGWAVLWSMSDVTLRWT